MSPLDLRGRHAQARPLPPSVWKCPACGSENSGLLEQGCAVCHAGKPGVHLEPVQSTQVREEPTDAAFSTDIQTVDEAYIRWRTAGNHRLEHEQNVLAYEAFKAGYQMGVSQVAETRVPLAGTAESRTIVAALKIFRESVLPTASEEIASGEWLGIAEVDKLIARLERAQ